MAMDRSEFTVGILKQEIDLLVRRIDHFDDLRHRTKQMAATLWVTVVGAGLSLPAKPLLWFALGIPVPFWYFDAHYNAHQAGFSGRLGAIRSFIRDGRYRAPDGAETTLDEFLSSAAPSAFPVFDLYGNKTFAADSHRWHTSSIRNAFTRKMLLFYGSLTLISIVLIFVFQGLYPHAFLRR